MSTFGFDKQQRTSVSPTLKRVRVTGLVNADRQSTVREARCVIRQTLNAFIATAIGTYNAEEFPRTQRTSVTVRVVTTSTTEAILEG